MKVLHSVLSLEVGGLENGVVNLVNKAPAELQVDVLCLRAMGDLAKRVLPSSQGKRQVLCAKNFDDHSLKAGISAHLCALAQEDYDIVHTHGWATMLSGALAVWAHRGVRRKRPLIVNGEHGVYYADHWRRRWAQRFLFKRMNGNLTVSADLGRRMEQAFGLGQTFHPILNGVDTKKFHPQPSVRAAQRVSLGFSDEHIVVGTVGRLVEIKNYPMLIESFAQLYEGNSQLRMVFCGDGDQRAALEALVSEKGLESVVLFTGRISNVADVMQAFDVFALSSDMEGLPNTLLEAMAVGVPAVVTDVGGSREVLPPGSGVLVPPQSVQEFVAALGMLVNQPLVRRGMAEHALAHVRECFTLQKMADQYYDYYRSLLNRT